MLYYWFYFPCVYLCFLISGTVCSIDLDKGGLKCNNYVVALNYVDFIAFNGISVFLSGWSLPRCHEDKCPSSCIELWKAPEKARSGPGVRIFPGSRMNFNVQYLVLVADEVKCIWCVTKYFLLLNIIQQINVNKLLTTGHLSLFLWKHVLILYKWPKAKVIMTIENCIITSVFRSICWHLAVKTKQQFT